VNITFTKSICKFHITQGHPLMLLAELGNYSLSFILWCLGLGILTNTTMCQVITGEAEMVVAGRTISMRLLTAKLAKNVGSVVLDVFDFDASSDDMGQ